jgi:hypothetical protein
MVAKWIVGVLVLLIGAALVILYVSGMLGNAPVP